MSQDPADNAHPAQIPRFRRLSAMDSAFLAIEDPSNLTHVGATAVFQGGGLMARSGRVDQARYLALMDRALAQLPSWRFKPARVPVIGHRVLVPDSEFALERHVRFVHLRGAGLEAVNALAAEFYSRMLQRDRPLWEQLVIDGLQDGHFAIVSKVHHAMVDGVAGVGALAMMLSAEPSPNSSGEISKTPERAPTGAELLRGEVAFRLAQPRRAWRLLREASGSPGQLLAGVTSAFKSTLEAARGSLAPSPRCVLTQAPVGPHRGYQGLAFDLERVRRVRRAAGCKLNDVVLATVAGGLDKYFRAKAGQGFEPPEHLRVMVPVSLHAPGADDTMGNQVSLMIMPLPLEATGPRDRLERLVETTQATKASGSSGAFAIGQALAEWTFAPLIPIAVQAAISLTPYHLIVTNVPGPNFPLYLLDSKLTDLFPMVPLYGNQSLAIALVSYDGGLYFGLCSDADRVRDLSRIADYLDEAFEELCAEYLGGEESAGLAQRGA
ncbi:MAG: wax ester/triacylglycerol synthase family O-acyltransferase [Polyangiaceae bacterium]